jgi:hypothetical protein
MALAVVDSDLTEIERRHAFKAGDIGPELVGFERRSWWV